MISTGSAKRKNAGATTQTPPKKRSPRRKRVTVTAHVPSDAAGETAVGELDLAPGGVDFSNLFGVFGEMFADEAGRFPADDAPAEPETGLDRIFERPVGELRESPENDRLYRPVNPADPEVIALANSILANGVKEPLVITLDDYIVSGHRRFTAAKLAGLATVPCRIEPIRRIDDIDHFVVLLREYNRQREKSFDERLREEIVSIDPTDAYYELKVHRADRAKVAIDAIELEVKKDRAQISKAKRPMLDAVLRILEERRPYWPLSDRVIHYALLNAPPLRHKSKPSSRYRNTKQSYKDLCDLLTRARLTGEIAFDIIADETRPVSDWNVYREPGAFIRDELDGFLKRYFRALQQSQPNHLEVLVEKNTLAGICKPICEKYCIPMTSGRGYSSLPPRKGMADRFEMSGKESLLLLIISDFDPDGEAIAESFARSMRDDFQVSNIVAQKVALTAEQAQRYNLAPDMTAKTKASGFKKFVKKYGKNVWEVEALEPRVLQEVLEEAILNAMDLRAFEQECAKEKADAARLEGIRRTVKKTLENVDFGEDAPGDGAE